MTSNFTFSGFLTTHVMNVKKNNISMSDLENWLIDQNIFVITIIVLGFVLGLVSFMVFLIGLMG